MNYYQIRQKMVSIVAHFHVVNEHGKRVFYVDGKALTICDTLVFKDMQGAELYRIKEKLMRMKDTMEIEGSDGTSAATVKKDLINILRDHWTVEIEDGPDLDVTGNVLDYDYRIKAGRKEVAQVSKKFIRMRDTYGVEIAPGQNDILILAITVALDNMTHSGK